MDNENKKITPERLYNLSERALNIGDWEYQSMILKERIDSFHGNDREKFDRVSYCIEIELMIEDSRKPKKVKKKNRVLNLNDLADSAGTIDQLEDPEKRAEYFGLLIDVYLEDDEKLLQGLNVNICLALMNQWEKKKEQKGGRE